MRVTLITCTIAIHGRWSVAGIAGAYDEVDLPVMRDPRSRGRAFLPGSSLAGSLRAHLGDVADEWLGSDIGAYEATSAKGSEDNPIPGRLRILGTRPITAPITSRGATAVDRGSGAADPGALRTEESVEGTTVTLLMEHEGLADPELVHRLECWRPYVGRGRTAGLGEGEVTGVDAITLDLEDPTRDHLTWWLGERTAYLLGTASAPADALRPKDSAAEDSHAGDAKSARFTDVRSTRSVPMEVVEPLHIGVHDDGDESRLKPTLRRADGTPYVPGASWKGVFRHRIAFILDAAGASPRQRDDLVEVLFGGPRMGRGLLIFHDSELVVKGLEKRTHVAIDRFTGGARDGSLFTLQSVPRRSTFTLQIDGSDGAIVENLVNHVLRDLSDGLIGVGGSGTRGYGWVSCDQDQRPVEAVDPASSYEALATYLPAEGVLS